HAQALHVLTQAILDRLTVPEGQHTGKVLGRLGRGQQRARGRTLIAVWRDLIETQPAQVGASPLLVLARGHRDALVDLPGIEASLPHPLRLATSLDQLIHRLRREATRRYRSSHALYPLKHSRKRRSSACRPARI